MHIIEVLQKLQSNASVLFSSKAYLISENSFPLYLFPIETAGVLFHSKSSIVSWSIDHRPFAPRQRNFLSATIRQQTNAWMG